MRQTISLVVSAFNEEGNVEKFEELRWKTKAHNKSLQTAGEARVVNASRAANIE